MSCKIVLDARSGALYASGSTVSGKLYCEFKSKTKIKGIGLSISGVANVKIKETSGSMLATEIICLGTIATMEKIYTSKEEFLLESINYSGEGEIEAGHFSYTFEFKIPETAPTSFKGYSGRIEYCLCAVIVKSGLAFNNTHKISIDVINLVDANQLVYLPQIQQPYLHVMNQRNMRFCCGLVTMEMFLDKNLYAINEVINIECNVNNASRFNISEVVVKLVQVVTFTALNKTRVQKTTLCKTKLDPEKKNRGEHTYHLLLPVNCNRILNMEGLATRIITVNYFVKVFCRPLIDAELLVYLAQIPLGASVQNKQE